MSMARCNSCARLIDTDVDLDCYDNELEVCICEGCRCDHEWAFVSDWYGDPNVINGTADCSYWRCKKCDEQTSKQPDEWNDKDCEEQELTP